MDINESIRNVLSFLTGNLYKEETLIEDCKSVRYLQVPELQEWIEYFRKLRQWEVNNFLVVLDYPSRTEFFDYMTYNIYLPFKHSRNIEAESILFGFNITISSMFIIELINYFLTPENKEKYGEKIEKYMTNQQINLYTITRSRFQGHKGNIFPKSDQQICDEMYQAYLRRQKNQSILQDMVYIGHYAELYVYNYLSSNPNLDVIWVSRYIGDGYGYDMMTYDKTTGVTSFIEVKGTLNPDNIIAFLTRNEKQKMKTITADNYRYIVYKLILDANEIKVHQYETDKSQIVTYYDPQSNKSEVLETDSHDGGLYLEPKPRKLEKINESF